MDLSMIFSMHSTCAYLISTHTFSMNRNWSILDWNIRGINSQSRWDDISNKIAESSCNVLCMQETKRESFDSNYLRNFCPRRLNQFIFSPSIGNSGGLITIWNGNAFSGTLIDQSSFHITVKLTCLLSSQIWYITNIYAPCTNEGRNDFAQWLSSLDSSPYELWIIMGDFNLIRSTEDRNRPGGNINNMLLFNSLIQHHDLEEIPLKGRSYTWSNMQNSPLLEKLDWIFTSPAWTKKFPNTFASPMARLGSDHIPILIQVGTDIPKCNIFRFEEYWLEFDGFK
jgi:exonuclease III